MMEHENERMNYSFESMDNSNGSEGYRQSSYDGSYHPNQDQDHNSNKKKNGIGGRMIALLVAVALVASIGGSALTSVINSISRKNEEANAKAAETMSTARRIRRARTAATPLKNRSFRRRFRAMTPARASAPKRFTR